MQFDFEFEVLCLVECVQQIVGQLQFLCGCYFDFWVVELCVCEVGVGQ